MLANKRILYIGPSFFNYEVSVKQTLEEFGAEVDYFDDRPGNDTFSKIALRLGLKFFIRKKINQHHGKLLKLAQKKQYDYIFVVSPEGVTLDVLNKLKKCQLQAFTILYMWDSFRYKNSLDTLSFFDKVITFDDHDASEYNLEFLPLFYEKCFEDIENPVHYSYSLCFIGTAHSDRYKLIKLIQKNIKDKNCTWFCFFYLQSRFMYWGRKLFFPQYGYQTINDFSFESLTKQDVCKLIEESRVVVDINGPKQHGLTSRTLEALGAKRKLITTNQHVKTYNFYNPNNILVIDRQNPVISTTFLETPYEDVDEKIYAFYSLKSWIATIFKT